MVLTLDKYVDIRHLHGNFLNRLLYLNQKPFQALSPFVLDYRVLDLDRGLWINHIPKLSTLAAELRSVNLHELGNKYWWVFKPSFSAVSASFCTSISHSRIFLNKLPASETRLLRIRTKQTLNQSRFLNLLRACLLLSVSYLSCQA